MGIRRWMAGLSAAALCGAAWSHGDTSQFVESASEAPVAREVALPPNITEASLVLGLAKATSGSRQALVRTYGQVVPDAGAVSDVNAYVSGEVRRVFVRPGDFVVKGQPIVSIYNPEFITTQKGHLQLLKNEERLQVLREEGRLPDYLKDARENLRWWGMTDAQIKALVEKGEVVEEILLPAPADGLITDVYAQPGTLVNAGDKTMKAFVVMGRSVARMVSTRVPFLLEGFLYFDQQAAVRPGTQVDIELPGGRRLQRAIDQVVPAIDARGQRARFLVKLGQSLPGLSIGQLLTVTVHLAPVQGVWVPRDAVLGQHLSPVVYVKQGERRFLRQPVTVLSESAAAVRVSGVAPEATVVTDGKMVLEGVFRMSGNPGAGAGGHHHHDD